MNTTASYGVIAGGTYNSAAEAAVVSGGSANHATHLYDVIAGGAANTVDGYYAVISGGYGNTSSGTGSFVGGGGYDGTALDGNTTTGNAALIVGGVGNNADANYSSIVGGKWNLTSGIYSSIPGGYGGFAGQYGQIAHASGFFNTIGDAQASEFVLRGTTGTDSTQFAELFLDGSSLRIDVPAGTAKTMQVILIGASSNGTQRASIVLNGGAINVGGTLTILGSQPTINVRTAISMTARFTHSVISGTDVLQLQVKGGLGFGMKWVASVRAVELTF
jgi:hypothetical protein